VVLDCRHRSACQLLVNAVTVDVDFQVSEYATLPANLCPFSGRRKVACFDKDFGEAVGEAIEANASSVFSQRAAEHL
jgi:hypothetical protein